MTVALFVLTVVAALGDWIAVWRARRRLELVLKPLTLILLIAACASAEVGSAKAWVLAALALSLVGDIALLRSPAVADGTGMSGVPASPDRAFLVGLGAFLLGHVAYAVAFLVHGIHPAQLIAGLLVVGGTAALVMPKVLASAKAAGLLVPVAAYAGALAVMSTVGVATAAITTAVGALLFLASDALLAWQRFVAPVINGGLLVIVSYHLAQLFIVLGLVR